MKFDREPVVPYIHTNTYLLAGKVGRTDSFDNPVMTRKKYSTFHALPKHWSMLGLTGSQVPLKA